MAKVQVNKSSSVGLLIRKRKVGSSNVTDLRVLSLSR